MNKIQKDQKQLPLLRCLEQKQRADHDPYTQTTPLWPESWTCPLSLTLFKGPAHPVLTLPGTSKRTYYLVPLPHAAARSPGKALSEFLTWLFTSFC